MLWQEVELTVGMGVSAYLHAGRFQPGRSVLRSMSAAGSVHSLSLSASAPVVT